MGSNPQNTDCLAVLMPAKRADEDVPVIYPYEEEEEPDGKLEDMSQKLNLWGLAQVPLEGNRTPGYTPGASSSNLM